MRFDPATYVPAPLVTTTRGQARSQPAGTASTPAPDAAKSREAGELDDWEDEGGATAVRPESGAGSSAAASWRSRVSS